MHGPNDSNANDPIAEMNVIPFIDICLVLLIIVLVTASFSTKLIGFDYEQIQQKNETTAYIDLKGKDNVSQAVVIDLDENGACVVNGKTVQIANLRVEVEALRGAQGIPPLVLRARRKVRAQYVVAAVSQARATGEVRLGFLFLD